jgi:hypothetical protein
MGSALSTAPLDTHSADWVAPVLTFDASVFVSGLHDHPLLQARRSVRSPRLPANFRR